MDVSLLGFIGGISDLYRTLSLKTIQILSVTIKGVYIEVLVSI